VLIGLRGGPGRAAQVWTGVLDAGARAVRPYDDPVTLHPPDSGWRDGANLRGCADLLAEPGPEPGSYVLLSVATDDPGDSGPFRSVVYEAADVRNGQVTARDPGRALAVVEGFKVEALAGGLTMLDPAAHSPPRGAHVLYTIATDDEGYGGVWRPLLAPPSPTTAPSTAPAQ
jgi:hypothetical protein